MKRANLPLALAGLSLVLLLPVKAASLGEQLSGRILLSVHEHGEAWYVNPITKTRSYLGRPEEALRFWHAHALGITNAQISHIPTETESKIGDIALRRRLSGRILLQVESLGEAWYVNPTDLKRYPLQSSGDALSLMRRFGLGITITNLSGIPMSEAPLTATVQQTVPFIAQAPLGEWSDPRQADGCEEASALMALAWARGESLTPEHAQNSIIAMSDWEQASFGYFRDSSAQDTAERLLHQYSGFDQYTVHNNIDIQNIRQELLNGNIVITPMNGMRLGNPYYRNGGPLRHMVLIIGYDESRQEFIIHDPGTRNGAYMRFAESRIQNALQDYNSGDQVAVGPERTAMIAVEKTP